MIVLTNCLAEKSDEGCLNVANNLIRRMKNSNTDIKIISYGREDNMADVHLELNKLFFNPLKLSGLKKEKRVLYVPFPAKPISTVIRIFMLSLWVKKLQVLLVMRSEYGFLSKLLLILSRAKLTVLSADSYRYYSNIIGSNKVTYIKTGVDLKRFVPVTEERKTELKKKYGIDVNKRVILHVGHMQPGRNIANLAMIDDKYQVVLVTSTFMKDERNEELYNQLTNQENILILDTYLSNIQEIYQLSDLYFFPVVETGHCIDVPLSCLEAAACNIPVLATEYGELKEIMGGSGFHKIRSFDKKELNEQIGEILSENTSSREIVKIYDWEKAVSQLTER